MQLSFYVFLVQQARKLLDERKRKIKVQEEDQGAHGGCFVPWLPRYKTLLKRTLSLCKQDMSYGLYLYMTNILAVYIHKWSSVVVSILYKTLYTYKCWSGCEYGLAGFKWALTLSGRGGTDWTLWFSSGHAKWRLHEVMMARGAYGGWHRFSVSRNL